MLKQSQFLQKNNFETKIKSIDYILVFVVLLIGIISCFAMYSTDGGELKYHTVSHIIRFSVIRITHWHNLGYIFYALALGMLFYVLFFGISASGSQRWINLYFLNLQPSELMKIGIIICFAKYYHRLQPDKIHTVTKITQPMVLLTVPILLVIAQPDLGTAILIAASGLAVIWLAGINIKFFIYSFLILLVSTPFVIIFLKPYQKTRILTFFYPEKDPLGAGYQTLQSKIAVGSGGMYGKGYLKGTQSYLDYLPEKHTDFIFTLFSEEFGFVGSLCLLLLFMILIYRIIVIGLISRSFFSKLYCFGFASSMFIYITVNMSMVLGLIPIVGSPLPIMSYGGSAMLSTMIGLSIVMSSKIYNQEVIP